MPESVERTIQYATVVDELPEAWAFVMERLEEVGPCPRISISPVTWFDDGKQRERFDVSISGMTEVDKTSEEGKV